MEQMADGGTVRTVRIRTGVPPSDPVAAVDRCSPRRGMVYFDARLSRNHPTVEVRIAEVCMDAAHATAIAALVRALVECAAQEWRAGTASSGDEEPVTLEVARILSAGTGAHRQRATMMDTQRLTAVVMDAVDRTHERK
jgi:glutamate---cysteine ligase / carboxylate-amine ligase